MRPIERVHLTLLVCYATALLAAATAFLAGERPPSGLWQGAWPVTNLWLIWLQFTVAAAPSLDPQVRRGWGLFAVATVFGVGADLAWIALGHDSRLSSVLSLVDGALCCVALFSFPGAWPQRGRRARTLLDLLTVLVAATVAMWDLTLRPALDGQHASGLDLALAMGSPILDLAVLIGAAALLMRRPDGPTAVALAVCAVSFIVYVITDVAWASRTVEGTYEEGGPLDVGWHLGRWLWGLAALQQLRASHDAQLPRWVEAGLRGLGDAVPILAIAVGFWFIGGIVLEDSVNRRLWGTAAGAVGLCALVLVRQTWVTVAQARLNVRLEAEKGRSERLLLNILPPAIARRLTEASRREPIADSHLEATVLFADLVGFTELSAKTSPERVVSLLDRVFSAFDAIADRHGLEKIKTIGDAYMAAAGVPEARPDHVEAVARAALEMREALPDLSRELGLPLRARIGLHTGPVVAGVIGHRKFIYDLWGDTVNTASRMESHALPGTIHISAEVASRLPSGFRIAPCGVREIKGKGLMETWQLEA